MREDHLIACSYDRSRYRGRDSELAIGQFENLYDGKYRATEEITTLPDSAVAIRFSAPVEDPYGHNKPTSIARITYEDLGGARRRHEQRRREALKAIADAPDWDALKKVTAEIVGQPTGTYRHFDIEDIRKAILEREKPFKDARTEADALAMWRDGRTVNRYFETVALRVRNGRVETSTGQSAAVESVRTALPVILRRRNSFGPVRNLTVDGYRVVDQSAAGVKVGCTLIPWGEVERLPAMLAAAQPIAPPAERTQL
jgi:hypothetical protein